MLGDMRRLVPSYENSRKRLLYHKTVFSRRIIQYCDELGIDELLIPDLDFEEPLAQWETVEEEINHLRERVRRLQRVVFELQMAVATQKASQERLKRRDHSIALKKQCKKNSIAKVIAERKERPKKLKVVNNSRFPRQSMSDAKRIIISKLKTQYERRVKEQKDIQELSQLLMVERKALASLENRPETTKNPAAESNKKVPTNQTTTPLVLTLEEMNAFLEQMCRPIPEPLSPIKSPEREHVFFGGTNDPEHPASRKLDCGDPPAQAMCVPVDLNCEIINSAILTSLSV